MLVLVLVPSLPVVPLVVRSAVPVAVPLVLPVPFDVPFVAPFAVPCVGIYTDSSSCAAAAKCACNPSSIRVSRALWSLRR